MPEDQDYDDIFSWLQRLTKKKVELSYESISSLYDVIYGGYCDQANRDVA